MRSETALCRLWISSLGRFYGSIQVTARLDSVVLRNDADANVELIAMTLKMFKYYDNFLLYMDRIILFNN